MATINFNEVVHALGLFCFLILMQKGDAYEFVVGGQKGWIVPSDPNSNLYNQWAEKSRFQVGDSLVFNYPSGQDSVIQVNNKDYESCNTDTSSEKFSDGHTVIKLTQSGPHFFISGNKNNCLKNEKLVVIVMADRTNKNSNNNQTTNPPSPSPSPSVSPSPSPLPTHSTDSVLVPSQAPIQQEVPPPPAAASPPAPVTDVTNTNPSPAPVSEPPPSTPNAASSILVSFVGSFGALMASVLVISKWSIIF